jgi:hypothetical protein
MVTNIELPRLFDKSGNGRVSLQDVVATMERVRTADEKGFKFNPNCGIISRYFGPNVIFPFFENS